MAWLLVLTLNTAPLPPRTEVPGFVSSGQLHALCAAADDDANPAPVLCLGYLAGATDQLVARDARRPPLRRRICLPHDATIEDLRSLVLKFQTRISPLEDVAAADVIRAALEARYPCGGSKVRP